MKTLTGENGENGGDLECRMAVGLDGENAPEEIMVMPAGVHTIWPTYKGKPVEVTIQVDARAAVKLQAALEAHLAAGPQRPYFDFDHEKGPASAWPLEFKWRDTSPQPSPQSGEGGTSRPGVYARVEWSKAGSEAVTGKMYRAFSPAFFPNDMKAKPAMVAGAPLCMGSLVNDPAFKQISPLWAKNGKQGDNNKETSMTPEELVQARLKQLETENRELNAKAASSETTALVASKDEEIKQLKQGLEKVQGEIKAKRKSDATAAVQAAVARGALPPKDEALQAKWVGLIENDPTNASLLEAKAGNPALTAVTQATSVAANGGSLEARGGQQGSVVLLYDDPESALLAYAVEPDPVKRYEIFASDLGPRIRAGKHFRLKLRDEVVERNRSALQAANSLGTLATDIVLQQSLALLQFSFPILGRISTEIVAQAQKFNQQALVRLISIPSVVSYNTSTGYASSDATAADVPVKIDQDKAVQLTFQNQELGSTDRDLFGEQAEAVQYALGKNIVDALYALILTTNFTNTAIVQASSGFTRITGPIAMAKALNDQGVPYPKRSMLLNTTYYAKLAEDTSIVAIQTNPMAGDSIQSGKLPDIHGFMLIEAPNLPTTSNLTAFGLFPSAMCFASRIPDDYTKALPGVTGGAITRSISNPKIGMNMLQVRFVDHLLARAYDRVAIQYGTPRYVGCLTSILRHRDHLQSPSSYHRPALAA